MALFETARLKETLILAWPIILGQTGANLMSFTDTWFTGQIGTPELAAAGIANAIFFIISIIGMGTVFAASALSARFRGEQKPEKNVALHKAVMLVSVLAGIVLTGITWFMSFYIKDMKQSEEVTRLAPGFLRWLAASTLPLMIFIGMKSFLDGLENTRPGMLITIVGVFLNIFLNDALIWGKYGMPVLGFEGSALATLITRIFMAVAILIYIQYSSTTWLYRKKTQMGVGSKVKAILKLGIPTGLQYFFEVGAFAGASILMGSISKETSAAHQIAIQIAALTYMIASGVSAAGTIQVGHALGAKDKKTMMLSATTVLRLVVIFMGFNTLLFVLMPELFTRFFTDDPKVIEIAIQLMIIAGFFQLSDGIQCIGLGLLRGIGDTKWPTAYTLIAYWGIGLPLGYILAFHLKMGGAGIWWALLIGLSSSAFLMIRRFYKKLNLIHFKGETSA